MLLVLYVHESKIQFFAISNSYLFFIFSSLSLSSFPILFLPIQCKHPLIALLFESKIEIKITKNQKCIQFIHNAIQIQIQKLTSHSHHIQVIIIFGNGIFCFVNYRHLYYQKVFLLIHIVVLLH